MTALLMTRRLAFLIPALACGVLLAVGLYLQVVEGLTPCPLCIFQRVAFMVVGGVALIAAVHGPRTGGARVYAGVLGLSALTGGGIAARQVWLQHLPADRIPECGPGLDFLLEVYPLTEAIQTVLRGSGDCAKVDWTLLGFSIAECALAAFIAVFIYTVMLYRARRPSIS